MKKNLIKYGHLLVVTIIVFTFIFFLKKYEVISVSFFEKSEYLFNYLGLLLGFALTIYTFLVSQYERIVAEIKKKYEGSENLHNKMELFNSIRDELKDDVWLIFLLLVLSGTSILFENIIIELPVIDLIPLLNLTFLGLSVFAINDLLQSTFKIAAFLGNSDTP
jgi:hypothetical protein